MSKKQHKNYVKFLDWKKQRNKDREIKKLDIKFNQWKDYEGKYKGRLLTPMEYQQFGSPNHHLIMSNRRYYKTFCQFDHMKRDDDFIGYLSRFVSTNPLSGKGLSENHTFQHLYNKLKYITLNDIYLPSDEDRKYGCCVMGNTMVEWELEKIKHILKDYIIFNKNRNEIMEELYNEDRMYEDEMDYQEEMEAIHNREDEYLENVFDDPVYDHPKYKSKPYRKDVVTGKWKKDEDDDELPF